MLGATYRTFLLRPHRAHRGISLTKCYLGPELESIYTDNQKQKILEILNDCDMDTLSRYDVAKTRLKRLTEWVNKYGKLNKISDLETVDGFTEKTVKNFTTVLLMVLQKIYQSCRSVLSVYVAVNSVCWTLIDKANYKVVEWKYHGIDYPENKRFQITDILSIAWEITNKLPNADIYVMKAEATSLRAGGSDPNNPKVLAFNLQKAQMIAMIVALINAKDNDIGNGFNEDSTAKTFTQKVYFLRPTLPYRLYGTLVGNEKVSTDQTIEMLLEEAKAIHSDSSHVHVPKELVSMYRSQKDLQKDMLGHCLLLALTFMDVCIYNNKKA